MGSSVYEIFGCLYHPLLSVSETSQINLGRSMGIHFLYRKDASAIGTVLNGGGVRMGCFKVRSSFPQKSYNKHDFCWLFSVKPTCTVPVCKVRVLKMCTAQVREWQRGTEVGKFCLYPFNHYFKKIRSLQEKFVQCVSACHNTT